LSILEELRTKTTPPVYAKILKPFPRDAIAQKLGIGTIHASNIITGYKRPGKLLEQKFIALAAEVERALKQEQGVRN
jgi:hypothetical protein